MSLVPPRPPSPGAGEPEEAGGDHPTAHGRVRERHRKAAGGSESCPAAQLLLLLLLLRGDSRRERNVRKGGCRRTGGRALAVRRT